MPGPALTGSESAALDEAVAAVGLHLSLRRQVLRDDVEGITEYGVPEGRALAALAAGFGFELHECTAVPQAGGEPEAAGCILRVTLDRGGARWELVRGFGPEAWRSRAWAPVEAWPPAGGPNGAH